MGQRTNTWLITADSFLSVNISECLVTSSHSQRVVLFVAPLTQCKITMYFSIPHFDKTAIVFSILKISIQQKLADLLRETATQHGNVDFDPVAEILKIQMEVRKIFPKLSL